MPYHYLDANIRKLQLDDEHVFWSTNCVKYLKSAIDDVNDSLDLDKSALKNDGDGHIPSSSSYRSELDITE